MHVQRELITHFDDEGKQDGFEVLNHCKTVAGDRRLLLNDKAISLLAEIRRYNEANDLPTELDDFIFLRRYKHEITYCTSRCFDPRLRKYCRLAGMNVIKSPHDIRRTVLTNLYMSGMPLNMIKKYAGHNSLKQTMDYIRVMDEDLEMLQYLNTLSDVSEDTIRFKKRA